MARAAARGALLPLLLLAAAAAPAAALRRAALPPRAVARRAAHGRAALALGRAPAREEEEDDDAAAAARRRASRAYINLTGFPFPLGPLLERRTAVRELHRGRMWAFEQEQSLGVGAGATISANVRMVVARLDDGSLWVLNPVAPTAECVALLRGLGGEVAHIVLGSTQYEHKVFVPPFARRFPRAAVWAVPQQWAWPLDLPDAALGLGRARALPLDRRAAGAPAWARAELPYAILAPRARLGLGYAAVEGAFVHAATRTLLVTDALLRVPPAPPPVLDRANLRALGAPTNPVVALAAAANWRGARAQLRAAAAAPPPPSARAALLLGWQRCALLALYFGPSPAALAAPGEAFGALAGRWIVGPVCAALVYDAPAVRDALAEWVRAIGGGSLGDFSTIVPAHFDAARGTRADVRRAFAHVLRSARGAGGRDALRGAGAPYRADDVQLLADLRAALRAVRVI